MPPTASTPTTTVTATQAPARRIRNGPRSVSQVRSRLRPARPEIAGGSPRRTTRSVSALVSTSADTMDATTPIESVTPNPLTGPDARKNSSAAASSVVTLESRIADHALRKPVSRAGARPSPRAGGVLLPGPLEDEHVGVDRQADREHEAGQPGQGQGRAQPHQDARRTAARSRPARASRAAPRAVHERDEQPGQREPDDARPRRWRRSRGRRASRRRCAVRSPRRAPAARRP